jgi:hypothetical protein
MEFLKNQIKKIFPEKIEVFPSITWEVINPLSPAQYQYLVEKRIPIVKIIISNPWNKSIENIQASIRVQDISDWIMSSCKKIDPKNLVTLKFTPLLQQEKLYSCEERNVNFEIKISFEDPRGKVRNYSDTKIVRILAKNDMIWSIKQGEFEEDFSQLIAAWVTPKDDEIQSLIHESANNVNAKAMRGLVGYQETEYISEMKEKIKLPAKKYQSIKIHLRQGCQISSILTNVDGGSGNDVNFALLNPEDMVIFERALRLSSQFAIPRVQSGYRINFTAPVENDYFLLFDNHFSTFADKNIGVSINIISPITHGEIVKYQLKAIYETIQQKGYNYVNTPISYAPGISQRVKRPSETIRLRGGNCIDGVVLFASCFESLILDTYIILLPQIGHSIVAVREWKDSNQFIFLETTFTGSKTFEESIRIGYETLKKYENGAKWIGITEARNKRIMPLT